MKEREKAIEFATKAHAGQLRKYTNEPYIHHPISVAQILDRYGFGNNEEIQVAAILHDTVEDTETTLHDIDREFGVRVMRLVEALTDVYTSEAFPNIRRKERKLLECFRISKIYGGAKSIKLADLIDNTSSIVDHDANFAKVYLAEKEEMLNVLEGGSPELHKKAWDVLREAKKKLGII